MQAEIIVEFDENSTEFKELWDGYKSSIDSHADYQSFAESISSQISRYGLSESIEGVGYLKQNGENPTVWQNDEYKEVQSIVNIEVDTDINDKIEFEVYYTEDLSEK